MRVFSGQSLRQILTAALKRKETQRGLKNILVYIFANGERKAVTKVRTEDIAARCRDRRQIGVSHLIAAGGVSLQRTDFTAQRTRQFRVGQDLKVSLRVRDTGNFLIPGPVAQLVETHRGQAFVQCHGVLLRSMLIFAGRISSTA